MAGEGLDIHLHHGGVLFAVGTGLTGHFAVLDTEQEVPVIPLRHAVVDAQMQPQIFPVVLKGVAGEEFPAHQ